MADEYCTECGTRLPGPGDHEAELPKGYDSVMEKWANKIIRGVGGLHDFEYHEMAIPNIDRDVATACWVLRCLGNETDSESTAVFYALTERRAKMANRAPRTADVAIDMASIEAAIACTPTRETMAELYGQWLDHMGEIDWPVVNRAIMNRWSRSALVSIKRQAWKLRTARAISEANP